MPDPAVPAREEAVVSSADAPGRVNLIGEHTDYHGGYVLPCAIPQRAHVRLRPRRDGRGRATSAQIPGEPVEWTMGAEAHTGTWADYVIGTIWALARAERERPGGMPAALSAGLAGGLDLDIDSAVPAGSGLSSSAALEVATLRACRDAWRIPLDDVALATRAHEAEVEFVGAPVGMMDQMACSLASEREALFLDTRTLAFERIPLPPTLGLVVIDSGITHKHAGGDYVTRRRESEDAAARLGVRQLRDLTVGDLARIERLLPDVPARRARHVVTENARVLDACAALRAGDLMRLGTLFNASHASMRDDYEVSVAEVDRLVILARATPHVFGARLTGGGFGGAVVIAVEAGHEAAVARTVADAYRAETGVGGAILMPGSASVR